MPLAQTKDGESVCTGRTQRQSDVRGRRTGARKIARQREGKRDRDRGRGRGKESHTNMLRSI